MSSAAQPFISFTARCFCQATEDEERVLEAFKAIVGDVKHEREETRGFHGNRILVFSFKTQGSRHLKRIAEILYGLRDELAEEMETRLDEERVFHVRFSKQSAFLGEVCLARSKEGGVVDLSLKVKSHPARWDIALKALEEWMLG